jgi:quercetin dioxygenase-like cupin family protein
MADLVKRYVVGLDENGHSAVLRDGVPNQQELKGVLRRATLWKTREIPVDNTIPGDRSLDGGPTRSPFPGGMLVRAVEFWPDPDPEIAQQAFADINEMVGHTEQISAKHRQRHPSMHRTDTLDVVIVIRGEVYLLLDEDEILLKPTDTAIIQGIQHGWSNRGDEPCLVLGAMIDAIPRQ